MHASRTHSQRLPSPMHPEVAYVAAAASWLWASATGTPSACMGLGRCWSVAQDREPGAGRNRILSCVSTQSVWRVHQRAVPAKSHARRCRAGDSRSQLAAAAAAGKAAGSLCHLHGICVHGARQALAVGTSWAHSAAVCSVCRQTPFGRRSTMPGSSRPPLGSPSRATSGTSCAPSSSASSACLRTCTTPTSTRSAASASRPT